MPSKGITHQISGQRRPQSILLLCLLLLLPLSLIACQSTASPSHQPASTPTIATIHLPLLPTTCPSAGTARAAVTAPLALGNHPALVYAINASTTAGPTFSAIDRLDLTTGTKTEILRLPSMSISDPQLSADGQWLLFISTSANGLSKLQMLRIDGEGLQTLYCTQSPKAANPSSAIDHIKWSPDSKHIVFSSFKYDPNGGYAYNLWLLDTSNGQLQRFLQVPRGYTLAFPVRWLDNTRFYLMLALPDGPPNIIHLLDTSPGANHDLSMLHPIFQSNGGVAFDTSLDSSKLFISTFSDSVAGSLGPSSILITSPSGTTQKTIYSSQNLAITTVRVASQTTLLLTIDNNANQLPLGTPIPTDTSHNGLWKINTDGTSLTRLTTGLDQLNQYTQYPWSNVSRDGKMYALESPGNGTDSLLYGSLNGGTPTTFVRSSADTTLSIVGWTTM
jgi:hypothetical protein